MLCLFKITASDHSALPFNRAILRSCCHSSKSCPSSIALVLRSPQRAVAIVAKRHAGAKDKGGAPYILHPLRMMLILTLDENELSPYCMTSAKTVLDGRLIG
jgi:(p)ppGpp synthase/HD superfamily hydrolase